MDKNIPWNKGKVGIYSEETIRKMIESHKGKKPFYNKNHSEKTKRKISISKKLSIEKINKKYLLFSMIEEMRYNPDIDGEIQVHCKNHTCINSKEKGGWFTPTGHQFDGRRRALEDNQGNDGNYFYCSQACRDICPLYRVRADHYKNIDRPYISGEYQIFRTFVLERDKYICQFCGDKATDIHHERPQKLEPFFALDPDYSWSCCEKCHYEKGHKDECSTGNLANKVCIG